MLKFVNGIYVKEGGKIKVCHVITTIDLGGAEKQLLTLASCQKKHGYSVEIIFLKGNPVLKAQFEESGIKINSDFANLNFISQVKSLRKLRKNLGVIYHAHLPRSELLCAIALGSKSFLVTRHNSEKFFPSAPKAISGLLSKVVLSRAYACIAISNSVSQFLIKNKEISRSKVPSIIYYGLSSVKVEPHFRTEDSEGFIRIGTVGRLTPQKNIPLLLKSASIVKSHYEIRIALTVVGTGPQERQLRALSRSLNLEGCVFWKGQIAQVDDFYKSQDIFILTSDYEGFGLVLLEAMSKRLPIIARGVSAIVEVLGVDHPGLVYSSEPEAIADKIKDFCLDKSRTLECLEYQEKQLLNFSIESTQKAHSTIYSNMQKG